MRLEPAAPVLLMDGCILMAAHKDPTLRQLCFFSMTETPGSVEFWHQIKLFEAFRCESPPHTLVTHLHRLGQDQELAVTKNARGSFCFIFFFNTSVG